MHMASTRRTSRLQHIMGSLDSRAKILGVILSLALLAFSRNGTSGLHMANLIPAATLLALAVRNSSGFFIRMRYVALFVFVAALTQVGVFLIVPGWKTVDYRSLTYLVSTSFCGISLGLFLTATTTPADFTRGLLRLGMPARATWMLTLAYRFLPLMRDEVRHSYAAATLRGFHESSQKSRCVAFLTSGITQRACDRAIRTGDAMFLRGFNLSSRRSDPRRLVLMDYLFLGGLPLVYLAIRMVTS